MHFGKLAFFGVTALLIVTPPVGAATLNTLFKINGQVACTNAIADANGIKTCSHAEDVSGNLVQVEMNSREENGDLGISGSITVSDNRLGINGGMNTFAEVSLNFSDTLFFSGTTNTYNFLLPFDLDGTLFAPEPQGNSTGGGGDAIAAASANITANGTGSQIYGEYHRGRTGVFDDEISSFGSAGPEGKGITKLLLPIVDGKIELNAGLYGILTCVGRYEADGGPCIASFDFLNSLRFLGGTVVDGAGNTVSGIGVTSASGFDYLTGVPRHISAVPLPASLFLLLAGICGLGVMSQRKQSRA